MTRAFSENARRAFATALLCTIWILLANRAGLPGWAGFAGCTAYFAAPRKGAGGLPVIFACVCSGMVYALASLRLGVALPGEAAALALTFLTTFLMCAGGKKALLVFVPGDSIGSFSTFAAEGHLAVIPALLLGILLGFACDSLGNRLCRN